MSKEAQGLNEVLVLGVKGSGKTVFLSVLGHQYEGVGVFGLSLRPDRQTWKWTYDYYHAMAQEDGLPQEFPPTTNPKDNPVPLTWQVRVGTEPLFRMTTLECAGETMVKAFGEAGNATEEKEYSEAMTEAFDAIDAGNASGVTAEADSITKLRVMAKRASVICLFLNPRDFESQLAALPGWFAERLAKKLDRLQAEGASPETEKKAREINATALSEARDGLKERYGDMLDLLRTFLDNDEYRDKRLVFVLTQSGDLQRAIEEAGGAWGFVQANIRQLEAYDLRNRSEALAVSAVNNVELLEEKNGLEREHPCGPIESTGLEDFLLTVGGTCSRKLSGIKKARQACLEAELRFTETLHDGGTADERWESAHQWFDAAMGWAAETENFMIGLENVRVGVKQRTRVFVNGDFERAERRWIAENALHSRLMEDVAAGRGLPRDIPAWLAVANEAVKCRGMEPWTLDELVLDEGWLEESVTARRAKWDSLKRRFDEVIGRLDWREAQTILQQSGLDEQGATWQIMEQEVKKARKEKERAEKEARRAKERAEEEARRAKELAEAEARRSRLEKECRAALEEEKLEFAERKLLELEEAEEIAGPSSMRPVLEEGLACLKARCEVRDHLRRLAGTLKNLGVGSSGFDATMEVARQALARTEHSLSESETAYGEENFQDLRDLCNSWKKRMETLEEARKRRRKTTWGIIAAVIIVPFLAWAGGRLHAMMVMESAQHNAIMLVQRELEERMPVELREYEDAKSRLVKLTDHPLLGVRRGDYVSNELLECLDNAIEMAQKREEYGQDRVIEYSEGLHWDDEGFNEREYLEEASERFKMACQQFADAMNAKKGKEDLLEISKKLTDQRREQDEDYKELEETARERGIDLTNLPEWDEWKSTTNELRRALRDYHASSGENYTDWTRRAQKALDEGGSEKKAVEALDGLKKAFSNEVWLVEKREQWNERSRKMDITNWTFAANRANSLTNAYSTTKKEDWEALETMLRQEVLDSAVPFTDEDRKLAVAQLTVCKAAAEFYKEQEDTIAKTMRKMEIRRVQDEVLDAYNKKTNSADLIKTVKGLGFEDPSTGAVVSNALRKIIELRYPQDVLATNSIRTNKDARFDAARIRRDFSVLRDLGMTECYNTLCSRVWGWNNQWLDMANKNAEKAAHAATSNPQALATAWKTCKQAEWALGNVTNCLSCFNPNESWDATRQRADTIRQKLPFLLQIRAPSRDIVTFSYNGKEIKGVRLNENENRVAILVGGPELLLTNVTITPSIGDEKTIPVLQFSGYHRTETKEIEF